MSQAYNIDFVKKDKDKLVKLVEPNFIYNRYDVFYGNKYELIEIKVSEKTYYVPLYVDVYTAKLGLYMVQLPQDAFDLLIDFVFKLYEKIDFIEVRHSINPYRGLNPGNQWTIECPDSEESYLNSLGKKTRLHIKQYFKYINRDFKVEFKTFDKDIPSDVVSAYYKFKQETIGHIYNMPEQCYLQEYQVTKAHVLYLDDKIAAVSFVCELDDSNDVYYENFSYDKTYSKYSLGTIIIYYTIKKLIEDGRKNFFMAGGGNYLYKQNMSTKCDKTYTGIIKRTKGKHQLRRKMFQYGEGDSFYYLRLFGLKLKKRKKKDSCLLEINKDTKCLMVCPHPDDDMFGAGAVMIKYSNNFDCLCMGSSGVATPYIGAKERSGVRIKEFHEVMDTIGVKNHWIFETYGVPRFDRQMDAHFDEYCKSLGTLQNYDYIFLPHPSDGHHEHRYITNKIFKRIAKKIGYSNKTKIVFYEVWKDMKNPNVFLDASGNGKLFAKDGSCKRYQHANSKLLGITDESLLELKYRILKMYRSQFDDVSNSIFSVQTLRTKAIKNGENPIGRFKVVDIGKYL